MTLEELVLEYNKSRKFEKFKNGYKNISDKIDNIFIALNVDPLLFKEGGKTTPYKFPDGCKKEFLTLIKYLDIGDESITNIGNGNIENADLEKLDFCINTVVKALSELGYSEDKVHSLRTKMLEFSEYSFLRVKKRGQALIDDLDYMYHNEDDNLSFSEHMVFQKYAESEICKLQEQLRFTYYSMNSGKGKKMIQSEARLIDKESGLKDYLQKASLVNRHLDDEYGQLEIPTEENKEGIDRRKKEIEIELFGEPLQKHPFAKYFVKRIELEKVLEKDKEYQKILQEGNKIISKKAPFKKKIKDAVKKESEKQERIRQISQEHFGYEIISPIREELEELEEGYQLLVEGKHTAYMWRKAKQTEEEDKWPIMISECEEFFKNK